MSLILFLTFVSNSTRNHKGEKPLYSQVIYIDEDSLKPWMSMVLGPSSSLQWSNVRAEPIGLLRRQRGAGHRTKKMQKKCRSSYWRSYEKLLSFFYSFLLLSFLCLFLFAHFKGAFAALVVSYLVYLKHQRT